MFMAVGPQQLAGGSWPTANRKDFEQSGLEHLAVKKGRK